MTKCKNGNKLNDAFVNEFEFANSLVMNNPAATGN
jgi:hypothetical protein